MAPHKASTTMNLFQGFPLLFCLLLFHLLTLTLASSCEKGQYYNASLSKCMKCSECPLNQIVRQPCKQNEDITCGPFIEFKFSSFSQKDGDYNDHNLPSDSIIAGNRHGSRENKTKYMNSIEFSHIAVDSFGHIGVHNAAPNSGISANQYETDRESGHRAVTNPRVEEYERITKEDSKYWRDLSFALIAVFCLIVLVATVVIWYLCRRCRLAGEHKITDDFDIDDADSSYVVLHHFHPVRNTYETLQTVSDSSNGIRQPLSLRGKRIYRPKRRLLNEYADDVFESEDSAGSKTSRRYPLQVIPENERSDSEGKDSDEVGHSSELPSSENNDDTESQVKQSSITTDTPVAAADSSTLNGDQKNFSPAQPVVNCIIDV